MRDLERDELILKLLLIRGIHRVVCIALILLVRQVSLRVSTILINGAL